MPGCHCAKISLRSSEFQEMIVCCRSHPSKAIGIYRYHIHRLDCHLLATAVCGPSNPEPDDNDFFWLAFAPLSYLFRYHYSNLHHDVPSNILLLSAGPDIACTCLHWAANQSIFIDESPTKYRQNHYPSTTDQHISICRE